MKRLTVMLTLLVALAATAWFVWAFLTERAVDTWLAEREAEGWSVTRETLSVGGFPAQFETVLTEISLADPETGWAWIAPEMVLSQAVTRPGRVEAIWPQEQVFASPFERVTLRAEDMRSALDVQVLNNLALNASETRMRAVEIESSLGWRLALADGRAEMIRQPGEAPVYRVFFEAQELVPPQGIRAMLDPGDLLPEAVPVVRSDAMITFDRDWDLGALEAARPQPVAISLTEARAEWGDLLLRSTGALTLDGEGRATGEMALRAENWEDMLVMAVRAGVLSEGVAGTARTAIAFIAGLSGQTDHLDATIRFEDGFMYLGPLPLGEGPRFLLR